MDDIMRRFTNAGAVQIVLAAEPRHSIAELAAIVDISVRTVSETIAALAAEGSLSLDARRALRVTEVRVQQRQPEFGVIFNALKDVFEADRQGRDANLEAVLLAGRAFWLPQPPTPLHRRPDGEIFRVG